MNRPDREIQKELDYASVYADGVFFRLEERNARLMFYQRRIPINESADNFEQSKEIITVKFEVRLNHESLKQLCVNVLQVMQLQREGFENGIKNNKDAVVVDAWFKFEKKLETIIYDTDKVTFDDKDRRQLQDEFDDLMGRVQRSKNDKQ